MVYSQYQLSKPRSKWLQISLAATAAMALVSVSAFQAFAVSTTIVTPGDMQGWAVDTDGSTAEIIADATAPGDAAMQLTIGADNSHYAEVTKSVSMPIDDLTELSYMTKSLEGPDLASASLAVGLDTDADGVADNYYNFEPYWQNALSPDPAPVVFDTWQTWDVLGGHFWDNGGGAPFYTWEDIKSMNPEAQVVAVSAYAGTYNPGFKVNVDAVTVNDQVYDFELVAPDASAPDVTITSPAAGGEVRGDANLAATITDDEALLRYYYFVRSSDGTNVVGPVTVNTSADLVNFTRTVDTTGWADGEYTFQMEARDAAGNKDAGSTAKVKFVVNNVVDTKEQCKVNGWATLRTEEGASFKNQGQCVAYVVSSDNSVHRR